jgi:hypothetical protein
MNMTGKKNRLYMNMTLSDNLVNTDAVFMRENMEDAGIDPATSRLRLLCSASSAKVSPK